MCLLKRIENFFTWNETSSHAHLLTLPVFWGNSKPGRQAHVHRDLASETQDNSIDIDLYSENMMGKHKFAKRTEDWGNCSWVHFQKHWWNVQHHFCQTWVWNEVFTLIKPNFESLNLLFTKLRKPHGGPKQQTLSNNRMAAAASIPNAWEKVRFWGCKSWVGSRNQKEKRIR